MESRHLFNTWSPAKRSYSAQRIGTAENRSLVERRGVLSEGFWYVSEKGAWQREGACEKGNAWQSAPLD